MFIIIVFQGHTINGFTKSGGQAQCPKDSNRACQLIEWNPPTKSIPTKYRYDSKYVIHYAKDPGYIDMLPEGIGQTVMAKLSESSALLRGMWVFFQFAIQVNISLRMTRVVFLR